MNTLLLITDVTRMSGTRVCVAGIDRQLHQIRPIIEYGGILEDWLHLDDGTIIQPFSKVILDLQDQIGRAHV